MKPANYEVVVKAIIEVGYQYRPPEKRGLTKERFDEFKEAMLEELKRRAIDGTLHEIVRYESERREVYDYPIVDETGRDVGWIGKKKI